MGGILRFLVRLIFVLVIGVLIGAGLFYGVPWIYRQLVWPVQENSAQIAVLQNQTQNNSDAIVDNHRTLQERIVALETEVAELRERTAAQAEDQDALVQESEQLAERVAVLEDGLEAQRQSVEEDIEQVRSDVSVVTADLEEEVEGLQDEVEETQEELRQELESSAETLDGVEDQVDQLTARLSLLQTAQDLLKVRLLLVEENPGVARETLQLALAHLNRATELLPAQTEVLDDLRERMLTVDDLIAEGSFRARPTLESLWADVMDLAMPLTTQATVTDTQETSPIPTPTAAP
jgi:chromosome segregation ATPase